MRGYRPFLFVVLALFVFQFAQSKKLSELYRSLLLCEFIEEMKQRRQRQ